MTDYTIVSRFRNRDEVNDLIKRINQKGFSCYNFTEMPADPDNADGHPEEQMRVFESTDDFLTNEYFRKIFDRDREGLRNAKNVILLLPAGISAHIEIGMAYGMGKKCILIGTPSKPETLYLLFDEYYSTTEDFISNLG